MGECFLRDRRDDIMNVVVYRGFIEVAHLLAITKIDLSGEESLMDSLAGKT